MKKTLILNLILSSILLTSCGNEQNIEKDNNIETKIQETEQIVKQDKEPEIKIIENNKELKKHKDGNVYLYKNGKQIDYLTSRAKKCLDNGDICMKEVLYSIINTRGKYGVVKKHEQFGECGKEAFYGIDLDSDSVLLTELDTIGICFLSLNNNFDGEKLLLTVDGPNNIVKNIVNKGEISEREIIDGGFIKKGNNYIKEINLSKILSNKKKVSNINNNLIKTGKYSHTSLINDGYKLNKLEGINEYYKVISNEEKTEIDKFGDEITLFRGFSENNTIYIEGNKILDFSTYLNAGSWFQINEPIIKESKFNSIDISQYSFNICQPIFGCKNDKIIMKDLDTIKIIVKEKGINETIWKRGEGFLK